ncbi:MAG: FAD-dependent oxidoreductase, partial [Parasporobacterium sp.]|nr:FAD-dependent oxidoreductase [Parasporobacterium sp.]
RFENANAGNIVSAVDMLYGVSIGYKPDYTGKTVVVIGGGNVAVDAARTAIRCNPDAVHMVYRRRQVDMTALFEEVNSAVTEGVDIMPLASPVKVEKDSSGFCKALVVKPQIVGEYDAAGRPTPRDAMKDPVTIPCDVIIVAIGQDIETAPFEEFGLTTEKGAFKAGLDTATDIPGVFVGGDCQSGPATAIKAVAAGKVAARNIDDYLGYYHKLNCEVTAPAPRANLRVQVGRVNLYERPSYIRKKDFELTENPMTFEEAMQESCRCLRCDHFGCGAMEGGCDR